MTPPINPHQKPQEDVVVTQEDLAEAEQWRFIEGRDSEYEGDFVTDLAADFARHRLLGHEAGRRDMREAAGWQPIETCPAWKHDHMHTVLAVWSSRSVCETYWDEDEDFDTRPKWWISPREGWRSPGDMCIPVNQDAVTHWMPKPAPPALPTEPLGGEG